MHCQYDHQLMINSNPTSGPAGVVDYICRPGEDGEVDPQVSGAEGHPGSVERHGGHDQSSADPL